MIDKVTAWFAGVWFRVNVWLDSFNPCHKEQMGYKCRHRIMSNGRKECGDA